MQFLATCIVWYMVAHANYFSDVRVAMCFCQCVRLWGTATTCLRGNAASVLDNALFRVSNYWHCTFRSFEILKLRMALVFPLCTKPGQNISGSRTVSRVHTAQHLVQGMEFLGQPWRQYRLKPQLGVQTFPNCMMYIGRPTGNVCNIVRRFQGMLKVILWRNSKEKYQIALCR